MNRACHRLSLAAIVSFVAILTPTCLRAAGPSISSLSPTSGAVGASVTISGSNFGTSQGSNTVKFNGTVATSISSWGSKSITAVVPSSATTGNVVVTVGGVASNGVSFIVVPAPVLASLSPATAPIGTNVTISGSNFGTALGSVTFNGLSASVSSWSATSVVAAVPSNATSGNVIVFASGVSSNGASFAVQPYITSVTPGWGPISSSQTITGTGFGQAQGSSSVTFNGVPASITSWSATSIGTSIPNGATTGNTVVTVAAQASNGVQVIVGPVTQATYHLHQLDAYYELSTTGPDPTISYVQSANLNGNSSGSATVGQFFTPTPIPGFIPASTTITFSLWMNESAAASGLSPQFSAYFYAPPHQALCTVQTSSTLSTILTKYTATCSVPQPATTSTPLWIQAAVTWRQGHSISGNVQAQLYFGGTLNGNYDSTVTVPEVLSTYVEGVSPASGTTGTLVTVSGQAFGTNLGSITFNGVPAVPNSWSDTGIVVPVPSDSTTGPVVVTSGTGTSDNSVIFTVTPVISSVSPPAGSSGTTVTIIGSGFGHTQMGNSVTFNGIPALPLSWSTSSVTVLAPPGAASGTVIVNVNGVASNSGSFTVGPTILALSPASGRPGIPVTISGSNFGSSQGSSTVTFNGTAATPTTWSNTNILAPVPTGTTTGPVVVSAGGINSNGVTFSIGNGTIAGTVTQAAGGAAVQGASVQVLRSKTVSGIATTDSNGAYSIGNLSPGTYNVIASATGLGSVDSLGNSVSAGMTTTVNMALPSPGTIAGQVTSSQSGTPLTGATINVLRSGDVVGSALSDSSGNYTIGSISPGTYTERAFAPGFQQQYQSNVVVTTGNTTTESFSLPNQRAIAYTYDPLGRLIGAVDPQGNAVVYNYDAVGNIVSTNEYSGSETSIIGFSPSSGAAGTTVTISGSGFSTTAGANSVTFNGSAATVSSSTATQIVVPVPAGATTGSISITSPQGTATSSAPFTVMQ